MILWRSEVTHIARGLLALLGLVGLHLGAWAVLAERGL